MKQFNVTGMSCAACSARIEKAVSKVPGVESCSVSLLTNSMGVEGGASADDVISAVKEAGYGASLKGDVSENGKQTDLDDSLKDTQTPVLRNRLIASLIFLIILMYVSMGHMMWNFPMPAWFQGNHVAIGLLQLLLSSIVMVINQKFFINGFKGLIKRSPNMDTLVALGSAASYLWSVYVLFLMSDAAVQGKNELAMEYMHDLYFESAAMILALITLGKMLEAYSKGKTTDALKSLMKLAPKTANIIVDGVETKVDIEKVKAGDIYVVRPGENIPVDGTVIEGSSAVNEAALTGESVPADKAEGDKVYAATINQSGFIKCEAVHVGEDTTLSHIIKMVSDAAATKAPVAKIADKVSGVFVPIVITLAVITTIIWLVTGAAAGYALARGISVLVISCPCALGLATPVAIMVGNGVGARNGILFKNSTALERTGKADIVVLDKTGTITKGEPVVTDIITSETFDEESLLKLAASVESMSEHPLAKAVVRKAQEMGLKLYDIRGFNSLTGNGVEGFIGDDKITGGSIKYISKIVNFEKKYNKIIDGLTEQGKTPLLFARGSTLAGIIAVADTLKEDSAEAIGRIKAMGLKVVMLTGDNEKTAKAVGKQAGVDRVIAEVLPDGKESNIRKLSEQGSVIMVGDGINDAPALTRADIGIAIGAGTDVAIDAADVVLMKNTLIDVPAAIQLSRASLRNIHENLFWAFIYNVIGIPLAAGVFVHFGLTLTPMFGAAAMSLSSFCVVSNALRLNLCRIYDVSKYKTYKRHGVKQAAGEEHSNDSVNDDALGNQAFYIKERSNGTYNNESDKDNNSSIEKNNDKIKGDKKTMKKTMVIEGMMCGHCEASVKKALEQIEGVESAEVSHEAGKAVVSCSDDMENDILKAAVEAQDYKVISID